MVIELHFLGQNLVQLGWSRVPLFRMSRDGHSSVESFSLLEGETLVTIHPGDVPDTLLSIQPDSPTANQDGMFLRDGVRTQLLNQLLYTLTCSIKNPVCKNMLVYMLNKILVYTHTHTHIMHAPGTVLLAFIQATYLAFAFDLHVHVILCMLYKYLFTIILCFIYEKYLV